MTIQKGDFVELDYTGMLAETQEVFDTTLENVAKEKKIHNPKAQYQPITLIVGEGQVVPGLDKSLEGKNPGAYEVNLKAEEAFGLKNPKLLKLIPLKAFTQQNIQPFVGLDVNIDGQVGIVRSVNGGRIIVDFNHPLTSKDLHYHVEIRKILTDPKDKIMAWFKITGISYQDLKIENKKATLQLGQELPEQLVKHFQEQIQRYTGTEIVLNNPENQKQKTTPKPEATQKPQQVHKTNVLKFG